MLLILIVILAILWGIALTSPAGLDFMKVNAFSFGGHGISVTDVLTGVVIVMIMLWMSGPLRWTAACLLVLWLLTLAGIPRIASVPLSPVIVFIIVVGAVVHVVTYKNL